MYSHSLVSNSLSAFTVTGKLHPSIELVENSSEEKFSFGLKQFRRKHIRVNDLAEKVWVLFVSREHEHELLLFDYIV